MLRRAGDTNYSGTLALHNGTICQPEILSEIRSVDLKAVIARRSACARKAEREQLEAQITAANSRIDKLGVELHEVRTQITAAERTMQVMAGDAHAARAATTQLREENSMLVSKCAALDADRSEVVQHWQREMTEQQVLPLAQAVTMLSENALQSTRTSMRQVCVPD
jgi:chromosome segregation ATPase